MLAWLIICDTADDVPVMKLVSPLYVAIILWLPTVNADVLNVVWPELRVPVPNMAVPSLNVTVPVGVPEPGVTAETVAANVTA